jgi:membrane protein DedA with SNARE-associated domain
VEKYSYRRFLLYDVSGEALGAIIPLLLGYTFSVSWEAVGDILGAASLLALAALFTIYLAIRLIKILPQRASTRTAKKGRPATLPLVSVRLESVDRNDKYQA